MTKATSQIDGGKRDCAVLVLRKPSEKKKRWGPYSPRINAKLIKDLHLKMKLYLLIRVLYADSGESYKSIKCNSTEK